MSKPLGVRSASSSDAGPLSHALARAFRDDPVHVWLFPDRRGRLGRSQRVFSILLRDLIPRGTVFTTPGVEGAALWVSPADTSRSLLRGMSLGIQMIPVLRTSLGRGIRLERAFKHILPGEPYWYLLALGVAPEHQEKGIGFALMEPVLDRCDEAGQSAHLETAVEDNLGYYANLGFELVAEADLPNGPTLYRMRRNPG